MDISNFLCSVEKWVEQNDDILCLILVGSYARGEEREDSDVDLVIITSNPNLYINGYFFDSFGKVMRYEKENWGLVTSLRVWYCNNQLEVEFGITKPEWIQKPLDDGTRKILSDGYKVIIDKKKYFKDIIL